MAAVSAIPWAAQSARAAQVPRGTPRVSIPEWPDETGVIGPEANAVWVRRLASATLLSITESGAVVGGLAHSWSLSPDRADLGLALRVGALFSDGRLIEPADVVASILHAQDAHADGPDAWRWEQLDAVEAVGDQVVFRLRQPDATFPALLASAATPILPRNTLDAQEANASAPASGMFLLRTQNEHRVTFVANPAYYRISRPRLAGIACLAQNSAISRATNLVADDVDLLIDAPLLDIPILREDPRISLVGGRTNRLCLLQINLAKPLLADRRLRAILSAAIDREELVRAATAGEAVPANSLVPPDHWAAWESPQELLEPENARSQLQELGEPPGLELRLIASGDDGSLANACVFLQEQLAWAGIALSLDLVDAADMDRILAGGTWDLHMSYTSWWHDPQELFRPLVVSGGSGNVAGYRSSRVDYLVGLAGRARDEPERARYYQAVQEMVAADVPMTPLFFPNYYDAMADQLTSYPQFPPESASAMAQAAMAT